MGTIIRGVHGNVRDGDWRVECWSPDGQLTWVSRAASWIAAWHVQRHHAATPAHRVFCMEPVVEVVEASPEEWPPAGYLGPSWDDLLPTPPAAPKPRGRVLVGAARALVGTVSGRPS
jgi:hypothetical protein